MSSRERECYTRGRSRFERGEDEAALLEFQKLLRTQKSFADVHYMVGVLQDRGGDLEAAGESFNTAVSINPDYAEALVALASVCERSGDYNRSRELALRAAGRARDEQGSLDATTRGKLANLQAAVADACAEVGDLREAIEGYRKALERCPDFHDIRHRLGVTLREAGLPGQALREFQRVLRGNPGLLDAQVQLGLTCYSLGRAREALERWQAVLEVDGNREDARMYIRLVSKQGTASRSPSPAPGESKPSP